MYSRMANKSEGANAPRKIICSPPHGVFLHYFAPNTMSTMLRSINRILIFFCLLYASQQLLAAEPFVDYSKEKGIAEAKILLGQGKMALLIPGSPPVKWQYEIRFNEYAKYGIEWRLTGDVLRTAFEEYRVGFNGVMADAILAKNGQDFPKKIELEIESKIRDARSLHE